MARKALIAVVLAFAISACAPTVQYTAPMSGTLRVQYYAVKICSFLPTEATVVSIVRVGGPVAETDDSVARATCSAVKSNSALRGSVPTVNGVRVRGHFVRKS